MTDEDIKGWNDFVEEIFEECHGYYNDCFFLQWSENEWSFGWAGGNTSFLTNFEFGYLKNLLDKRGIEYHIVY